MDYSPRWYGPNANPIPETLEATITQGLRIKNSVLLQRAQGDKTTTLLTDLEVPIISQKASIRIYGYGAEHYQWSDVSREQRGLSCTLQEGDIVGDIYLQTRVRLMEVDNSWKPDVVLNYTLKTASPKPIARESMRFFDTPGYFFHLEIGRNIFEQSLAPCRLRLSGYVGFMCWETVRKQNDAFMYTLALSSQLEKWHLFLQFGGYNGWMKHHYGEDYGDEPMHITARCDYQLNPHLIASLGLERGLRDYPFTLISLSLCYATDWSLSLYIYPLHLNMQAQRLIYRCPRGCSAHLILHPTGTKIYTKPRTP